MPRNQGGRKTHLERDLARRVTPSLGCSTFTFAPHGTRRLHAAERSTCSTPKPPAATCMTAPAVYAPRVRGSPSVVPKGTAPSRRVGRRSGSGPASLRWNASVGVEQCGPIPPPSRGTLSPTYRQVCGEISTLGVRKRVQEQRRLNPDQTLSLVTAYVQGQSVAQLARSWKIRRTTVLGQRYDVDPQTVSRELKKIGVQIRPPGRSGLSSIEGNHTKYVNELPANLRRKRGQRDQRCYGRTWNSRT